MSRTRRWSHGLSAAAAPAGTTSTAARSDTAMMERTRPAYEGGPTSSIVRHRKAERAAGEHQADAPDEVVQAHTALADHAAGPPRDPGTAGEARAGADDAYAEPAG